MITQIQDNDGTAILSLSGTALLTTYVAGTRILIGAYSGLSIWLTITWKSGTSVTSTEVKVQGSYDGTNFVDLQTVDAASGTVAVEQTYAATAASTTYASLQTTNGWLCKGGIRVLAKSTGAAAAGDLITGYAVYG